MFRKSNQIHQTLPVDPPEMSQTTSTNSNPMVNAPLGGGNTVAGTENGARNDQTIRAMHSAMHSAMTLHEGGNEQSERHAAKGGVDAEDQDVESLLKDLEEEAGVGAGGHVEEEEEEQGPHHLIIIPDELLNTDPRQGLTTKEADKRRAKFGPNQLAQHKENQILKFLGFFVGPIQYVMIAAAILAGALQHWVDFGVILGLLLLNAVVGFLQEYQAGNIVAQLKSQLALSATTIRNGQVEEIDGTLLVPGDIVRLEEGTIIPADGRVLGERTFLQVDQSGGSHRRIPRRRKTPNDEVYSSSSVKRGSCVMVVTGTGDNTYVGRTASLASSTQAVGKFTEVLRSIGTTLLFFVVFFVLAIWISGFFRSIGIVTLLDYALIITVIGVPVGLPAVVTTTLAVGAAYLARKQAIVQRLSAIESLAGCEILCSDKTGTLTKNKLVLHEPFLMPGGDAETLVLVCALASSRSKKALDAIDKTVMLSLLTHPKARAAISTYQTLEFQLFDPVTKRVVAVVRDTEGRNITCLKGAPPAVLKYIEQDHPIDRAVLATYNAKVAEFASRGFRALGAAWKREDEPWQIIGILCLFDPPRHDTAKTVTEAKELGLSVKMLTGDAVGIARETGRQLQLGTNIYNIELLVDGSMPGSELYDFVVAADGFAEVFPEHKYMVVDILQKRGYLVAMTGDGVNDAPSLKKADAGIAVEGSSDAARTAADIVFLAPGLGTIIDAIKTSRQIFHRMYSYVVYRIALSLHLEIFLCTSLIILNRTINVELVVFLAIFADIATLAIAYDRAPYSHAPVKWDLPKIWAGTWILYGTLLIDGKGIIQNFGDAQQILFLEVTLTENWLIFITRCEKNPWETLPSWQLVGAVLVVDILATLFCLFGWFTGIRTDIVTVVRVWLYSIGVTAVIALIYFMLANSKFFSNIVRGRMRTKKEKRVEDFMYQMEKVSQSHERKSWRHEPMEAKKRIGRVDSEELFESSSPSSDAAQLPLPAMARHARRFSIDPDYTSDEEKGH
ncbi:plasma membrane H+-ATPase [Rhizophlyctis rosea]|uniref:Plasma membrane ATPase n=1 Tax=Rhizophlyctis rosea TaxID=64517 RepID=A0AAD5SMB6_9FUNG|nr:plasma membrane H+-ATPase [Rhizophlyctis rosea]